jgi:glycosyltransferase involved in cell wall biosynthesis
MRLEGPRLALAHPCVDDAAFHPRHRDAEIWNQYGVTQPQRLLYCGRISEEKNLSFLSKVFGKLCGRRSDTAMIFAGEGPYTASLKRQMAGLPAHFVGTLDDSALASLYASSDLLVFPSRTDTLGQVVMEAQASGLPVLVSDEGGPREVVDDGLTGYVLRAQAEDVAVWVEAIEGLLDDEPRRQRLSRTAATRMARYTPQGAFEAFWDEHVQAAQKLAQSDLDVHSAVKEEMAVLEQV